ncbi:Cu2+-exporting ATPase [Kordiimonas lacus]|uniref:Cu2+-exporting ATPase n=1 Tax=Kordiimonas lacus TaxID=637679 RepID=A0A1G6ZFU4_9PROT|nr:Cu2+-exporting ATPase [Kordiimonas lacus]
MEAKAISADQTSGCCKVTLCRQCGLETSGGADFCCPGCEAAYAAASTLEDHAVYSLLAHDNEDGSYTLSLGVEGIHCASCIRLIENALAAEPDVTGARVNMSTERLTVTWTGARDRGDKLGGVVTKLGYKLHALNDNDAVAHSQERTLLRAIAVAGFAAANMMLISIGLWSTGGETMGVATRDLFHWISALIALPTVIYAGQPFYRSAWAVLKEKHTNMDVPISLAVILACVMSVSETLRHGEHVYFDSAVMLLFFLLIGRYLDARAKGKARESASKLQSRLFGVATVLEGGKVSQVPIKELRQGALVLVATGESIPADGIVERGASAVDMSLITGETVPEAVAEGADVFAGTVNLSAPLQVRVSKASEKSLLSEIVRLMETSEQGRAKYVRLADKAARLYTPVVHAMGALTFIGWWLLASAPWQESLLHAVTVLIITCPCALGLAVPVVQVLASGKLMRAGVLLKSGDALEKLTGIDTVVFDKTGTLTIGRPELKSHDAGPNDFALAASLAAHSKHPLAGALRDAFEGDVISVEPVEVPGHGMEAHIDGKSVRLGSRAWCGGQPDDGDAVLELWLAVDGQPKARFQFADQLRTDAKETVSALKARGLEVHLLSGDRTQVATDVGAALGIDRVQAEVKPAGKCAYLADLKEQGRTVLMVGDGLNDAPALSAAAVSMSPSSAMDITQNTADVVFQGDLLSPVLTAYDHAVFSTRLVKQNFALAALYNVVAIPAAVLGFVTPLVAAVAMSGSSLVVILNAFRLNLRKDG